jgi:hypothetical protein
MGNNVVINLLDRYGWQYKETDDGNLVAGFQGISGDFLLGFDIQENWLVIFTIKYLPKMKEGNKEELLFTLLKLNSKYPYTRFAMTSNKDIIILADVVIGDENKVKYDAFQLAMDMICEAVDSFYPTLYERITGDKLAFPIEDKV